MDLLSILATVILVTTLATLVVGIVAYAAFKLRDKRNPKKKINEGGTASTGPFKPIFLTRYDPDASAERSADA